MAPLRLPVSEAADFKWWNTAATSIVELKPSLLVRKLDSEAVIILGREQHRVVRGEALVALLLELRVPRTVEELQRCLAWVRPSVVYKILHDLWQASLINIWDESIDLNSSFELCLSPGIDPFSTTIGVIGSQSLDDTIAGVVEAALAELGFKIGSIDDSELCILLMDTYLDPNLVALGEGLLSKQSVVPAKLFGPDLWLGPLFRRNAADLLLRFRYRLFSNHPIETRLMREDGVVPVPFNCASRWTSEVGARILARILKEHLYAPSESLSEHCITFDYRTLRKRCHSLRSVRSSGYGSVTVSAHRVAQFDGGKRSATSFQFLEHTKDLISPITGLVPDLTHQNPAPGIYVCHTVQIEPAPMQHKLNRRFGSRFGAAGKGESLEQATASCIGEALERYSACYQGNEENVNLSLASAEGSGVLALDPRELMLFSAKQYRNRALSNDSSFHYVPEPFDPDETIAWVKGFRWCDRIDVLVPAAYVYFNYNDHASARGTPSCFADSNGCAVGSSFSEALSHALCELIERDACAVWWYNRLRRPAYDLATTHNEHIAAALRAYAQLARNLVVLDLTNDINVPVACAVSWDSNGRNIGVGLGCDLDSEIAVSRAICELHQFVCSVDLARSAPGRSYQNEIVAWISNTSIDSVPHLTPAATPKKPITRCTNTVEIEEDVTEIVRRLAESGLNTHYVDLTRPETGVSCVRAIVPGLRHFWARLAPGRLYDVPVQMGWLAKPLAEDELNPTPFFL